MSPRGVWQVGQRQRQRKRCPIKCENLGVVRAQDGAGAEPKTESESESGALLL